MTTVNPIPISPLETHDPYYLPPSTQFTDHDDDSEAEGQGEQRRGRDTSPRALPNLHSRSVSPARNPNPLEFTRRKSNSTVYSAIVQAHHTLPSASASSSAPGVAEIDPYPVLYLPPLLSPLPHKHNHNKIKDKSVEGALKELEFATRLPDIDPASLALHQVLHSFRPLDQAYSTTPYDLAFNWADLVCSLILFPSSVDHLSRQSR